MNTILAINTEKIKTLFCKANTSIPPTAPSCHAGPDPASRNYSSNTLHNRSNPSNPSTLPTALPELAYSAHIYRRLKLNYQRTI